jgi:peptide/nickel transport system substrate-binding protein
MRLHGRGSRVNGDRSDYRTRARRQHSRRTILRGALTGVGLAGAFALACRSESSQSTDSPSGAGQTAQDGQAGSRDGLSGRIVTEAQSETPVRGGTLAWSLGGNPPSLDPHRGVSVNTTYLASGVMSRLFRLKTSWDPATAYNQEIEPDLGLSYESPDGLTWTYKLRPDATFHNVAPLNGRAVTSEDIKATFVRAVSPTSAHRGALLMIDPNKIETPDSSTVVFKLTDVHAPFPKLMASNTYGWILPREGAEGVYDPATKMIGSGPFTFESFQPDVQVTLKRNPDWFEQDRPYVDGVKIAIIPDQAQRYAQFTAGNVDALYVAQEDVPTLTSQNPKADVVRSRVSGNGIMYYQLSESGSIFQDIRLRQAASLAVDRKAYGNVHFRDGNARTFVVAPNVGKWAIAEEEVPPETMQWYNADLQRAKQLMEAAGGSGLSIKMVYAASSPIDTFLRPTSETIHNMLKSLPWDISYVPVDYIREWQAGGKGYAFGGMPADSMAWWGLSSKSDVDEYLYAYWHSRSTSSISRLSDAKLDAMIDKARTIVNDDDRLAAYKDVQAYILANVYCLTGMVNGPNYLFVQPRVRNLTVGDDWGAGANTWSKLWLAA